MSTFSPPRSPHCIPLCGSAFLRQNQCRGHGEPPTQVCDKLRTRWGGTFGGIEGRPTYCLPLVQSSIKSLRPKYVQRLSAWLVQLKGDRRVALVVAGRDGFLVDRDLLGDFFGYFSGITWTWTIYLSSIDQFVHVDLHMLQAHWDNPIAPAGQAITAFDDFLSLATRRLKDLSVQYAKYRRLQTRGRNSIQDEASIDRPQALPSWML